MYSSSQKRTQTSWFSWTYTRTYLFNDINNFYLQFRITIQISSDALRGLFKWLKRLLEDKISNKDFLFEYRDIISAKHSF